jgi:hypothetical protein
MIQQDCGISSPKVAQGMCEECGKCGKCGKIKRSAIAIKMMEDKGKKSFKTHEDLAIYQLVFETAIQIFECSNINLH